MSNAKFQKQFIKFPNGKVWAVDEHGWIQGSVIASEFIDKDLELALDDVAESVTGSISGLTNFSYQYLGGDRVSFHGCASVLDEESDDCQELALDSAELRQLLMAQYQLSDAELSHLLAALGSHYENECVIRQVGSTREICCPAFPAECDYVRITVDGMEVAYWVSDEWAEAPAEVMGAILGAVRGAGVTS